MRWPCKSVLTRAIRLLPPWLRYPLTVLLFWPTVAINRFVCWRFPAARRLWDRVPGTTILVGSVPCRAADVRALAEREGVRGVVNLCREWDAHAALYGALGLARCWAPTIDFDAPTLAETLRAVAFIKDFADRGETVLVHCKAGRGRSVCVALAYLVLHRGLAPREADALIRRARPHISKKWHLPLLAKIARIAAGARRADALGGEDASGAPAGADGVAGAADAADAADASPRAAESDTAGLVRRVSPPR